MAQPASRQEFIDYCKRQLGAPVLEVNVAEEQISDLIDDAIQHFNERHFDGSNTMSSGMFSMKYQLFLNDIHYWGNTELLTYSMLKRYLEDIDFLLTTEKQIRFNQRMDRLYLDIDWQSISVGDWLIMDCFRALNPVDFSGVWNDSFLKPYATALIKRQWGQNLLKFQGVKLPGGVELNGRQIYDDAQKELDGIRERMSNTYEIPPLDFIG